MRVDKLEGDGALEIPEDMPGCTPMFATRVLDESTWDVMVGVGSGASRRYRHRTQSLSNVYKV